MGTRSLTTKSKDGTDISWRIEEIENGYIVTKEWYEKEKGKDKQICQNRRNLTLN